MGIDGDILKQLEQRTAALGVIRDNIDAELVALKKLNEHVRSQFSDHPAEQAPNNWRIIENGGLRYCSESEAKAILQHSEGDLLLDVRNMKLRYVKRGRVRASKPQWIRLNQPHCRILTIGLSDPDEPFGNRSYNQRSRCVRIKTASLSRYVHELTKLIQGGDTQGPYLHKLSNVGPVSDTRYGYVFDPRWHYVIVEAPPPATPPPPGAKS